MTNIDFIRTIRGKNRSCINEYLQLLKSDFKNNVEHFKLVCLIFGLQEFGYDRYNHLHVDDFEIFSLAEQNYQTSKFFLFSEIDKVAFEFKRISQQVDSTNPYLFFSKFEYPTYEELKNKYPGVYYIHSSEIIAKIDSLFFESLKDYKKEKANIYSKCVHTNIYIKFDANKKRHGIKRINQYLFPDLYIEIDGNRYDFASETDLSTLLFLPASSFSIFYLNSVEPISEKTQFVIKKNDEPVVYENKDDGKFTLTNSHDNLLRYNKFILVIIELFLHYFRVLEEWILNFLLPKILNA